MKRESFLLLSAGLILIATTLLQIHAPPPQGAKALAQNAGVAEAAQQRVVEAYGKLPLHFELNQGQADAPVKFLSRGSGYTLFLTANETVLSLPSRARKQADHPSRPHKNGETPDRKGADTPRSAGFQPANGAAPLGRTALQAAETAALQPQRGTVLRMKLVGANPAPGVTGFEELPGKSNYFLGDDPAKWRTNVPNYAKVRYENVYPGIDLVYYGNQPFDFAHGPEPVERRQLDLSRLAVEYDFVVAPGADPRAIRLAIRSVSTGGTDAFVTKLNPAGSALAYSTYLGGSRIDRGKGIAVDSSGNAYVTGQTTSTNFPTANPFQAAFGGGFSQFAEDAFVTKLNAAGSALVYSTYLGGNVNDGGAGIAVDSSGNAYVTGYTGSPNFPTANAFQGAFGGSYDAFVTKLNAAGSALLYSTYLGGSGGDNGYRIAVDSSGNAYVAGHTESTNFPTTSGGAFQTLPSRPRVPDSFVAKLNPSASGSASLVYSTYLGGSDGDIVYGIAVDSSGNAYVTGRATSTDFPTTTGAFQTKLTSIQGSAFVTKLNPFASGSASLVYSTYLGAFSGRGFSGEWGNAIAVDSSGNAYVTGNAVSTDFPITPDAFQTTYNPRIQGPSPFVAMLNPGGDALVYSTYLSGISGGGDTGQAIAVDSSGNIYVTGTTFSFDFPTTPGAFQAFNPNFPGVTNVAFVAKIGAAPNPITAAGLVNGASFTGRPPAAGAIVSLFGSNLASANAVAGSVPLPTSLGGATVWLNNVPAPLFFVSPGQINFQIPWELRGWSEASLTVSVGTLTRAAVRVNLSAAAPGIFATNAQGTGQGAILIAESGEVAAPGGSIPGSAARPVSPGESITIYCTGLGDVTNRPASGAAAGSAPLSSTLATATVTIGGVPASVSFSGLAPGFVGLYQVNVQVPANAPTGSAVPVVLTIAGATSNTVTIAVQ